MRTVQSYLGSISVMKRRKTRALVQVARTMLDDPTAKFWGYDLSKASGVLGGVLYPMLSRMLEEGWLTDGWEDPATIERMRPPRRYYELTDQGRLQLHRAVEG